MNALYFGPSERALFGAYHPPASRAQEGGVVLCYLLGQEQIRAHRAIRQLAAILSKSGFHVLRFDYFGTGDSAGETTDGNFSQWVQDIGFAVEELKELAGVSSVSLVGLRLGANLAAAVATVRDDIDSLVHWDPIVRGVDYLQELLDTEALLGEVTSKPKNETLDLETFLALTRTVGVVGFPMTPVLRDEMGAIDLLRITGILAARTVLMTSAERKDLLSLRDHLESSAKNFVYRHIPSPGNWCEVDTFGSVLLPQAMIQGVSHQILQGVAA